MSDKTPQAPEKAPEQQNPDEIYVKIGNSRVPFNRINKPHTVVLGPKHQKPVPQGDFPDLTPEAKAREAELEKKQ